jgi:hypothetical protein
MPFLCRPLTVLSLTEMIQEKSLMREAISDEIYHQELELDHKKSVIDKSIRCPISNEVRTVLSDPLCT